MTAGRFIECGNVAANSLLRVAMFIIPRILFFKSVGCGFTVFGSHDG
jgi:hypothetical protein